jgi:hypothetical protein
VSEIDNIIAKLEQQRQAIDRALVALRGINSAGGTTRRGRRTGSKVSAEARRRMSEAQKRRWARTGKGTARKRVLSPEGRARIAEATRKRWAAIKKARG